MFMTYEVMATFGISLVLSFSLSIIVLLMIAAKRGYFRIGKGHLYGTVATAAPLPAPKGQVGSALMSPSAPPLSMVVELESLKENPN